MDTVADVTMTGETTNTYFGRSVASAGDVNGAKKKNALGDWASQRIAVVLLSVSGRRDEAL
jgi:hypothetical protein